MIGAVLLRSGCPCGVGCLASNQRCSFGSNGSCPIGAVHRQKGGGGASQLVVDLTEIAVGLLDGEGECRRDEAGIGLFNEQVDHCPLPEDRVSGAPSEDSSMSVARAPGPSALRSEARTSVSSGGDSHMSPVPHSGWRRPALSAEGSSARPPERPISPRRRSPRDRRGPTGAPLRARTWTDGTARAPPARGPASGTRRARGHRGAGGHELVDVVEVGVRGDRPQIGELGSSSQIASLSSR